MSGKTPIPVSLLAAALCAGAAGTVAAGPDGTERLVLNFKGSDDAPTRRTVPVVVEVEGLNPGDPMVADCFEADVFDLDSGRWLGTAEDCLVPLGPELRMTADDSGTGEKVVGTTVFDLRQGRLVIQGMTSVQPVNWPTANAEGQTFTHVTGANSPNDAVLIPNGDAAGGGYEELRNTGRFRDVEAVVRLSGQVDLSAAPNEIAFDCIFVVDLRPAGGDGRGRP